MKIGILQCDSVFPQFQDQFGNYPEMFISLFKRADPNIQFQVFDVEHGDYPQPMDVCDGYITTGSKASVYEDKPWITALQDYFIELNQQNKKLVAVCFGHQLVAQAFGGVTSKSDKGWGVGVHSSEIHTEKAWMNPPLPTANLVVSHQDQVTKLPKTAELIAGNAFCPYGMFQLGDNILTLQGHPEFSKAYSKTLMHYREEKIGTDVRQEGIRSLQKSTDEAVMAQWIIRFLSPEPQSINQLF